jgi:hypothetical protein
MESLDKGTAYIFHGSELWRVCCVQAAGMTQLLAQVNVTQVLTSATTALIMAERVYNATNGLNLTANGQGVRSHLGGACRHEGKERLTGVSAWWCVCVSGECGRVARPAGDGHGCGGHQSG